MKSADKKLELKYLNRVKYEINKALIALGFDIREKKQHILELKRHIWQNIYEMDYAEIAFFNQEVHLKTDSYIAKTKKLHLLRRLYLSPYFGRIDFNVKNNTRTYYIGLGNFTPNSSSETLIYDWRAPVAGMFYDYEIGPAKYISPSGMIRGVIIKKRQYKIQNGEMQYMFDTSLTINDEILQKELSRGASLKMKNIVATIQKDQNKIIRNEKDEVLIIQGVAGSGKTSIALHRIAYLLYKHKGIIKSNNILIISPNKIFSDYISNVLPELGEENIVEMRFDDLANQELKNIVKFETKYSHLEKNLSVPSFRNDGQFKTINKSSPEFLGFIEEYLNALNKKIFICHDLKYKDYTIKKEVLEDLYFKRFSDTEPFTRLSQILNFIIERMELDRGIKLRQLAKDELRKKLHKMFVITDIRSVYTDFLDWLKNEKHVDIYAEIKQGFITYEDVWPIVLMKLKIFGAPDFSFIKHLVIDEMQEYTPVQYAIINHLFQCPKTILGDIMQIIDPHIISAQSIFRKKYLENLFGCNVRVVRLKTSYRSTIEIMKFAQSIIRDTTIKAIKRRGDKPILKGADSIKEIGEALKKDIRFYKEKGYTSIAILCKTSKEANKVFKLLKNYVAIHLLTVQNKRFATGTVVAPIYLVKGLEFDCVIIPQVDKGNYAAPIDRQLLYVACTRALHQLKLYYTGTPSEFINRSSFKHGPKSG